MTECYMDPTVCHGKRVRFRCSVLIPIVVRFYPPKLDGYKSSDVMNTVICSAESSTKIRSCGPGDLQRETCCIAPPVGFGQGGVLGRGKQLQATAMAFCILTRSGCYTLYCAHRCRWTLLLIPDVPKGQGLCMVPLYSLVDRPKQIKQRVRIGYLCRARLVKRASDV